MINLSSEKLTKSIRIITLILTLLFFAYRLWVLNYKYIKTAGAVTEVLKGSANEFECYWLTVQYDDNGITKSTKIDVGLDSDIKLYDKMDIYVPVSSSYGGIRTGNIYLIVLIDVLVFAFIVYSVLMVIQLLINKQLW